MVIRKDLLSMGYYKLTKFKGSDRDMRFVIEKNHIEEEGKDPVDTMKCTRWFGPLSYEKTDPAIMEIHEEEFSEAGLDKICDWLNEGRD